MTEVYIFIADGFEEIEGLTVVDLLRRAGIDIQMVSITGKKTITGSHGIKLETDLLFEEISADQAKAFVLPGGMPGTNYLAQHRGLGKLLKEQAAKGKLIAAICAAPTVLGSLRLLTGKKAVCYPGMEGQLTGAKVSKDPVAEDGNVTTSRGVGTAIPFALTLIAQLKDQKTADEIGKSIVYYT